MYLFLTLLQQTSFTMLHAIRILQVSLLLGTFPHFLCAFKYFTLQIYLV